MTKVDWFSYYLISAAVMLGGIFCVGIIYGRQQQLTTQTICIRFHYKQVTSCVEFFNGPFSNCFKSIVSNEMVCDEWREVPVVKAEKNDAH